MPTLYTGYVDSPITDYNYMYTMYILCLLLCIIHLAQASRIAQVCSSSRTLKIAKTTFPPNTTLHVYSPPVFMYRTCACIYILSFKVGVTQYLSPGIGPHQWLHTGGGFRSVVSA